MAASPVPTTTFMPSTTFNQTALVAMKAALNSQAEQHPVTERAQKDAPPATGSTWSKVSTLEHKLAFKPAGNGPVIQRYQKAQTEIKR